MKSQTLNSGEIKRPLLSFVIPTYNFGKFIGETIRSIIDGALALHAEKYEIIILDGGSTDNTTQVVTDLIQQHQNIRYEKKIMRGGIDRDLNEVSGMASGEYIWFFSADDLLVPGWDTHIIPLLEKYKDIYLVPAKLCDYSMELLRKNPIFNVDSDFPVEFNFDGSAKAVDTYLERMNTLEALFSFMSAVIVKSEVWQNLKERPDYFGSCWAHCVRLLPSLFQVTTIVYVNNYLIKKRGGNDSFMENGLISRIGIAVNGWGRIIFEFFDKYSQRHLLIKTLQKDMPILLLIYAKMMAKNREEVLRLDEMALNLYWVWSTSWMAKTNYFLYRFVPGATRLNRIIEPYLHVFIRLRHKSKSFLTK